MYSACQNKVIFSKIFNNSMTTYIRDIIIIPPNRFKDATAKQIRNF